ncbi:MAG TPA: C4-type zinc ribbon domain-containing protein [Actinomycetota bacterium]|nr:C4-type zinc ribbon domain-containing protein [Actinomycetota bacterium]
MEPTRETVRPLLELQRIDSSVDRLNGRAAALPEQQEMDRLTEELAAARKTLAERELGFGGLSRDTAKLEAEVEALSDKIKHENDRLYSGSVGSPKELTAIQAEIDGLRKRKNHVEDQLLELMEKKEAAEKDFNESKEQVSGLESQVAAATVARDTATTDIAGEIEKLQDERRALLPSIPEEAVEVYEQVRPKKEGVAVAAYEHGVCRGCMVELSPVARDEIKRSDDPFPRCENCRRILIVL